MKLSLSIWICFMLPMSSFANTTDDVHSLLKEINSKAKKISYQVRRISKVSKERKKELKEAKTTNLFQPTFCPEPSKFDNISLGVAKQCPPCPSFGSKCVWASLGAGLLGGALGAGVQYQYGKPRVETRTETRTIYIDRPVKPPTPVKPPKEEKKKQR